MDKRDLENCDFLFSRKNGSKIGKVHLAPDGTIKEYENPNERRWLVKDEELLFLNDKGQVTTSFKKKEINWIGTYYHMGKENPEFHILTPIAKRISQRLLETEVIETCNLSCENCNHLSPYVKESKITFDSFLTNIQYASRFFAVERFRLLGGEPLLLGNKLEDYIDAVRTANFANNVDIITNGTLLHTLDIRVLNKLNLINLSLYDEINYKRFHEWYFDNKEKLTVKFNIEPKGGFEETFTPKKVNSYMTREIWKQCCNKENCNAIINGKFYLCARAYRFPQFLKTTRGIDDQLEQDGIDLSKIENITELENEINTQMRGKPLKSCYYCYGGRGPINPHRQLVVDKIL